MSCGKDERVWLPVSDNCVSDIYLHPWCVNCGIIKNLSDDKGKNIGYWMNVLSKIADRFSLKQVQRRQIAKELLSIEWLNDKYSIRGSAQKDIFKKIVNKYSRIDIGFIESYIY